MTRLIIVLGVVYLLSSCASFTSTRPKEEIEKPPESEIAPDVLITAENYVSDGITHYQNANYKQAVFSWQQALELIPGDAEIHNFLGISYHKLEKLDEAETHFRIATELDPSYYEAHNNLGYVLFLEKKYEEANEAFQKALKINPNYDPAKLNYEKTKKVMSGELSREVFELTEQAEKFDDLEKKIEYYKKILSLDSTYAEGHNNIAVAYYYADQVDSAYMHLNKALKLRKEYPEALNNLGYIYKVAGRYQDAIKLFLNAISLKQKYIIALNNLGETYELGGEYKNAQRVFRTVLEVDPGNEYALDSLTKLEGTVPEGTQKIN